MATNYPPFGFPTAQQDFQKENDLFFQKFPALCDTMGHILDRTFNTFNLTDRLLASMGHVAHEEFFEIFILAGNGLGIGAMKLLRGFYEMVVIMADFVKRPTDAESFLDFHYINEHKAIIEHAKKRGQLGILGLSTVQIQGIEDNYQRVKGSFKGSWHSLNLSDMADDVDRNLSVLYSSCFLLPTFLAHTTAAAVVSRTRIDSGTGRLAYDKDAQKKMARSALVGAHNLLLRSLDIVNDYFKLGLDAEISDRCKDFMQAW
jgi:hypothetical protein